jgi:hypothetical protein
MSKNKLNILIIPVSSVLILFFGYLLLLRHDMERADPLNAIPQDASVVIKIQGSLNSLRPVLDENKIWRELLDFPSVRKLNFNFLKLDSLLSDNHQVADIMKESNLLLSFHPSGKNKISYIVFIELLTGNNEKRVENLIETSTKGRAEITDRKYSGTRIRDVIFLEKKSIDFSYAFSHGLFMISPSGILIEESIKQLEQQNNSILTSGFMQVSESAGQNVEANIFINYRIFPKMLSLLLKEKYKNDLREFDDFADWAELDASIREDIILLNGFTATDKSRNEYLDIFQDQLPQKIEIEKVLPEQTVAFLVFSIQDIQRLRKQYKSYLKSHGVLENYEAEINSVNKQYEINLEEMFYSFMDKEAGIFLTDNKNYDRDQNTFFILKTLSQKQAEDNILDIITKAAVKDKISSQDYIQYYQIDNETKIKIYRMPVPFLAAKLLGRLFEGIPNQYCTFYDNYLIFGNSIQSLARYVHANLLQNNLGSDLEFNKYSNFMSTRANIYFYMDIPRSTELIQRYLNDKESNQLDENKDNFKNFHALAVQITNEDNLFYNNIFLTYASDERNEPQTVWESRLDNPFDFKPKILINHNTQEKEIFIQDKDYFIYLINSSGRILWKLKLESPVMSDIFQIDYYNNGKLQYLFNTKTRIHLIDRNGNNVEKYPIILRSPATNGMAVFDYENNKDYRLFIATDDREIYAYSKEGQTLKGWSHGKTEQILHRPVHHFRLAEKDYIVCADAYSTYILDRKGETRVNVKAHFPVSGNNDFRTDFNSPGIKPRIAITDTSGHIHFIYFDGSAEELICGEFTGNHYFEFTDLNGDNKKEFIYADGNELKVYNLDKKLKFSRQFKSEISFAPVIYQFSDTNFKIGITCSETNDIYLINNDGSIYQGFPLKGSTQFSITNFGRSTGTFNLLVGSNHNFLYNYSVK